MLDVGAGEQYTNSLFGIIVDGHENCENELTNGWVD